MSGNLRLQFKAREIAEVEMTILINTINFTCLRGHYGYLGLVTYFGH